MQGNESGENIMVQEQIPSFGTRWRSSLLNKDWGCLDWPAWPWQSTGIRTGEQQLHNACVLALYMSHCFYTARWRAFLGPSVSLKVNGHQQPQLFEREREREREHEEASDNLAFIVLSVLKEVIWRLYLPNVPHVATIFSIFIFKIFLYFLFFRRVKVNVLLFL